MTLSTTILTFFIDDGGLTPDWLEATWQTRNMAECLRRTRTVTQDGSIYKQSEGLS
ncbi:hypothetical protein PNH38_15935 [Anoxybacillus rupiensis]|uniref:Uncharacterized protein n=1 Tax=Anoxybacteroides rupiense TaxID=311460 RepID=A0ABT5W920_9BACL|nr:hypothetical protein [Anoxybacillus rupiensis]